jgi:hypothetical protein
MSVKISEKDLSLLNVLLAKEAAELRIEIHHTRSHEYREFLKERERQVNGMLARFKESEPLPDKIYV